MSSEIKGKSPPKRGDEKLEPAVQQDKDDRPDDETSADGDHQESTVPHGIIPE